MEKIYLSHSTNMDYRKLYDSLTRIENVKFMFPHARKKPMDSKGTIRKCSALVADVSEPSHGVGIEMGWANSFGVPIILVCRKGSKVSSSLKMISGRLIQYKNFEDAKSKIENELSRV